MSRVFEYSHSFNSSKIGKIDIHDRSKPLKDRLAFMLLMFGKVTINDMDCTEDEFEKAADAVEADITSFDEFAKRDLSNKLRPKKKREIKQWTD